RSLGSRPARRERPMAEAAAKQAGGATATQETAGLLDSIIAATRPQDQKEAERAKSYFKQFLGSVVKPGQVVSKDVEKNIKYWIGELDKKLSSQLNEVMHHEAFQKLESSWRGLHYLVQQSETGTTLKIRVMNARKTDIAKDLEKAIEIDQSVLLKKLYEEEYGQLDGAPYGMLTCDYQCG